MIWLQIYIVIIAVALAWLNRIPCVKMNRFGASRKEEKEWHLVNPIMKGLFAAAMCIRFESFWQLSLIEKWYLVFVILLLEMWVVFDIALAVFLHGWKQWDYLGDTAKLDRVLKYGIRIKKAKYSMAHKVSNEKRILGLGDAAGLVKLLVACVIVLIVNFYL